MKRIIFTVLSVSLLILTSCSNGQNEKTSEIKRDSVIKPKTDIQVNKEYDDDGNLIKYDSVYTEFYSTIKGDKLLADSILNKFKTHFYEEFPFSNRQYFKDLFFNDSLLIYDFYKKDFFGNRFDLNRDKMNDLFKELDSVKNEFYKNTDSL